MSSVFQLLHPKIKESLSYFGIQEPTVPQTSVIPTILLGEDVLLVAPTGSGKTEAAILPIFDALLKSKKTDGIQFIYITPLRALNRDMYKRMVEWANFLDISIEIRHSDTTQKERRRQEKKPPQILITTPETLQAILSTKGMKNHLKNVNWIVIDEIHELAASKRGSQLSVGLERLDRICLTKPQRIGLSATIGNPLEIAQFLGGISKVKLIETDIDKDFKYKIEFPEPDIRDFELGADLHTSPKFVSRLQKIKELVESHTKTLIFVQGRGQAESIGNKLNLLNSKIDVHHGSLSREQRHITEDQFKTGKLKAIVCTSTLQLGIDVGEIDLIIQYNSPRKISTLIQRVGRSGHSMTKSSNGVLISSYDEDLIECIASVEKAQNKELEHITIYNKPYDVLCHQLVGLTLQEDSINLIQVQKVFSQAYPYKTLTFKELSEIVSFASSIGLIKIEDSNIMKTKRGQLYYYENLGMINDEKRYPFINVVTDKMIGTVGDEFWNLRARIGLNVILRGKVWKILQIDEENGRLFVLPSDDPLGALPGWDGELIGVPKELTEKVSEIRFEISNEFKKNGLKAIESISERYNLNPALIRIIYAENQALEENGLPLPTKNQIVIEAYDKWIIIHSGSGNRVNTTLGCIFDSILSEIDLIHGWWNDAYRILLEAPHKISTYDLNEVTKIATHLTPDEAEKRLNEYLDTRFSFTYNFKFIAERFGVIPRGKSIGPDALQRIYRRYRNSPIYLEALQEIYATKLDINSVKEIINKINLNQISIINHLSNEPSPLAKHILEAYSDIEEIMIKGASSEDQLNYMRKSILARKVKVACMNCVSWHQEERLWKYSEKPICGNCGSSLLAVMEYNQDPENFLNLLQRYQQGVDLVSEEKEILSKGRKTADLVLSYGRRALEALSVHGVGPVTAYQILSRMQQDDKTLYSDLLKAKIQYMRTRQYWAERSERMK
ncbi:DEAD/DEAH box helicase [Candidatus Bathyarchaeota archaeon]|nr:DEAD/DEAH box helicase [Candidatus Bathyarchaeota archaeon]